MSHTHRPEPSLVRYRNEEPYLSEFDASNVKSEAVGNFFEDNMSIIISGILLLLLFYLARPQVPDARFRGRFRRQMRQLKEALAEKPAEREDRIEKALTKKFVTGRDAEGNLTLGEQEEEDLGPVEEENMVTSSTTAQIEDEEEGECVICLEPFEFGDEVAWSNVSKGCRHVWHTECIRSWLRESNHEECPSCRAALLPERETKPNEEGERAEEGLCVDSTETDVSSLYTDGAKFVILKGQDCVSLIC